MTYQEFVAEIREYEVVLSTVYLKGKISFMFSLVGESVEDLCKERDEDCYWITIRVIKYKDIVANMLKGSFYSKLYKAKVDVFYGFLYDSPCFTAPEK